MTRRPIQLMVVLTTLLLTATGCSEGSSGPTAPTIDPDIDPADFVTRVDNPFFPLVPGTTFSYEAETDQGQETQTVEVLDDTKIILGIAATVVHDRVFVEGELTEDTFDWYAQDKDGNVWYLGEDTREVEDAEVVSTDGSWEAGIDGAKPGIIMWGDPAAHIGEEYRQEYYEGVAEDLGKVVAVNESVTVPFGSFTGCVKTEDRNALEPGILENKYYCPQTGVVLEVIVRGGTERNELVDVSEP
jgi:hypothetical protein